MELLWVALAITVLSTALSFPAIRYQKRTGRKLGRGTALAGLQVVNELFQPSAANAAIILEEQKEARVATPSPADKLFDQMLSDYNSKLKP